MQNEVFASLDKILKSLDWQHLTLLFPELQHKIKPKGTVQSFDIKVESITINLKTLQISVYENSFF